MQLHTASFRVQNAGLLVTFDGRSAQTEEWFEGRITSCRRGRKLRYGGNCSVIGMEKLGGYRLGALDEPRTTATLPEQEQEVELRSESGPLRLIAEILHIFADVFPPSQLADDIYTTDNVRSRPTDYAMYSLRGFTNACNPLLGRERFRSRRLSPLRTFQ